MNDTLKVAGRIGAELGAAKAEIEALREQVKVLQSGANSWQSGYDKGRNDGGKHRKSEVEQLRQHKNEYMDAAEVTRKALLAEIESLRNGLKNARYRIEQGRVWNGMGWTLTGLHAHQQQKALDEIDAALSQQSEPTDTYTATDMATAAAQGFRDGQAAVEQAPAQDELWAVHAQGPDELYAAFGRDDAEQHAAALNALPMPAGIQVSATVIASPWSAAEHWKYLAEQEREHAAELKARAAQTEQHPMAYAVFAANGNVVCFSTRRDHPSLVALERNGHSVVTLAPIAQTAPQPEQSALVLPRAQLERIERRLTDWLELNCCECESGHLCGRNEVTADRDAIRAALSAQGGQQ